MKGKLIIAITLTSILLICGGCVATVDESNGVFTVAYSQSICGYPLQVIRDNETQREYILYLYDDHPVITPRLDKE